jgi:microcystin-dependent protein
MSAFVGEGSTGPADDRPLNDQEYQLLQRLLSDPFSLPQQFKTWLISYLESSDLTLPMSAILGLNPLLGITGAGGGSLGILPAGLIFPYGGGVAPPSSKLCDGGAYVRTAEPRLFAAIGTTYGAPDGARFSVPDLQERVPVGKGYNAYHASLGQTEGVALGSRSSIHQHGNHTHNIGDPGHQHGTQYAGGATTEGDGAGGTAKADATGGITDLRATGVYADATLVGVAGTPGHTPAYITLNFIIVS